MIEFCYFNGKFIPRGKVSINAEDIGILRGYGIFEFIRTYNGKPFLLKEHLDRFEKSAQLLNLKIPVSRKKLIDVINKLIKKNNFKESIIRIVLTGGKTINGLDYDYNSPTLFILNKKLKEYPDFVYKKGVKVITHYYQRQFSSVKTINYITAVNLQPLLKKEKAHEILYVSNGRVLEGTTSNFFIFKHNVLITPKNNILIGTTRNLVLKLAKNHFRIKEKDIFIKELRNATEAFITSTNKEIMPVVKIDNLKVGDGKVGKNTKFLIDLFKKHTQNF